MGQFEIERCYKYGTVALKGLRGSCTTGMPWTISGPGQPLHVPGKSYPQLAATALMAQEIRFEKILKTPLGKFHIDRYILKMLLFC